LAGKQAEQRQILSEAEQQVLTWAERGGRRLAMRPVTKADLINVKHGPYDAPYLSMRQAEILPWATKVKLPVQLPPRPESEAPNILPPQRRLRALGRAAIVQIGLHRSGALEPAERKKHSRRIVAVGALAVTAIAAAAGLYLGTKGHHAVVPHGTVSADQVTPPGSSTVTQVLTHHHHHVKQLISPDRVTVLPGQGYTDVIDQYAAQSGHHLTGAQDYRIYQGLERQYGSHILSTPGYSMGGSNFGIAHPGPAHWQPGVQKSLGQLIAVA
jgi:hypothetical protein